MEKNTAEDFRPPATVEVASESSEENHQTRNCDSRQLEGSSSGTSRSQLVSVIKQLSRSSEPLVKKSYLPDHIIFNKALPVPYKCTICGKTFKSKSNCCYHKHCANSSEKPFSCSTCNRRFATKTHFKYHSLMHTGLNPYKCSKCSKSFKTKHKLTRHERIHSDKVKNFSCDICGRSFLREASVKVHQRSHTDGKLYSCSECPKAFREKKNLIFHIRSHKGLKDWVCEVCGKSYAIKWNLELHKRTHTRVRPFQCTVAKCHQSFSQNRYLKRHMETHGSSIKFVCSICEKVFSRKDNLQRHVVNTHLEYQSQNALNNQKVNKVRDNAVARVKPIAAMPQKKKESRIPAVRTVSVIKLVTRTHDIVDYNSKPVEIASNCISVIKKVDNTPHYESDELDRTFDCDDGFREVPSNRLLSEECIDRSSDFPEKCFYPGDEVLQQNKNNVDIRPISSHVTVPESYSRIENVDCTYTGTVRCELRSNVISHTSDLLVDEDVLRSTPTQQYSNLLPKKSRCLLPKKVITASYKECSYTTCENQEAPEGCSEFSLPSDVEKRYRESYNLLDLSYKGE